MITLNLRLFLLADPFASCAKFFFVRFFHFLFALLYHSVHVSENSESNFEDHVALLIFHEFVL